MSPFESFSKSATDFSSDSFIRGTGPEAIIGEESLGKMGQGEGGVVRVGGQCFGPEELKIGCVLWVPMIEVGLKRLVSSLFLRRPNCKGWKVSQGLFF